jgi:AcrR family transcriptional regulator
MDDIAADLGISKATLYKTVHGKEDLLRRIVRSILGAIRDRILTIVNNPALAAAEKLVRLFSVLSAELSQLRPAMARDIQKAAPDIWTEIETFRRERILIHFRSLLEAGKSEGVFRPETDIDLTIHMFLAMIQSFVNLEEIARGDRSPSQTLAAIVQVFFGGILTDTARLRFERSGAPLLIPRQEDT